MSAEWQSLAALALTLLALAYVCWRGWQLWRGEQAGCGSGCKSCAGEKPLVTLEINPK